MTIDLFLALLLIQPQEPDRQLKEAGVCARCHVISVVEWGVAAGHWKNGTNCIACHGLSQGHVIDERNNVKPERLPHAADIAGLCLNCHQPGCPKTRQKAGCQDCHHVHALVNPNAPPPPAATPGTTTALAATNKRPDPTANLPKEIQVSGLDGLTLMLIPGGEVDLGADSLDNAKPVHTVRVRPFYLAATEVTVAQWHQGMGTQLRPGEDAKLPKTNVSWQDAQAFVAKLGAGYRLPTEAEWEFAARAAGSEDHVFGQKAPRPAGQGTPNKLGLYNLLGNVWEWTSTLAQPYPYNPNDGRESLTSEGLRVLKGGGYSDPATWVSPATRHPDRPTRHLPWYGLRLARGTS